MNQAQVRWSDCFHRILGEQEGRWVLRVCVGVGKRGRGSGIAIAVFKLPRDVFQARSLLVSLFRKCSVKGGGDDDKDRSFSSIHKGQKRKNKSLIKREIGRYIGKQQKCGPNERRGDARCEGTRCVCTPQMFLLFRSWKTTGWREWPSNATQRRDA